MVKKVQVRYINSMKKHLPLLILSLMILVGFGVRMIDLTDLPLDFHPTRQLHSAILARGIYATVNPDYSLDTRPIDKQLSQTIYLFEPPILEYLVAGIYLITGEVLWAARLLNITIWMIGAVFVYNIANLINSHYSQGKWGGLFAVAVYLFLPFGITASRSFQPDVLMVVLTLISFYGMLKFLDCDEWKFIFLGSIAGALAILVKGFAVFFVGPFCLYIVLKKYPIRNIKKTLTEYRLYAIAFILLAPIFYYLLLSPFSSGNYFNDWFISLSSLLMSIRFYVSWLRFFQLNFTFWLLILALIGTFFISKSFRTALYLFWAGYFIYCFSVPHQTMTHNYYHLITIPLISISASPLFALLGQKSKPWSFTQKFLTIIALIGIIAFNLWQTGSKFLEVDYRDQATYWKEVGAQLPQNESIIALTQHYGYPLIYWGRRSVRLWPDSGELFLASIRQNGSENFNQLLDRYITDVNYFLVTDIEDFNRQSNLQEYLFNQTTLIDQDDDFLLFKLN